MPTATQIFVANFAMKIGVTSTATISSVVFLAFNTGHPILIKYDDRYPPPMLPNVVEIYITARCMLGFVRSRSKVSEKYAGSQKRKNHHMGSVSTLPIINTHVCLKPSNCDHLSFTGLLAPESSSSLLINCNSGCLSLFCFVGIS